MDKNIPTHLLSLEQWHHWEDVDGRKVPKQVNGRNAKANDPATWTTLEESQQSLVDGRQLAFTLGDKGTFLMFDFDDCFDASGHLMSWAEEIIEELKPFSYCEHSPSGNGVKLLCFGQKPHGVASRFHQASGSKLEVFDNNRFWAWTGDVIFDNLPSEPTETPFKAAELLMRLQRQKTHRDAGNASRSGAGGVRTDISGNGGLARASAYADKLDVGTGDRNNTLYHLVHKSRSFGASEAETQVVVTSWNARLADPLGQQELDSTFRSAWQSKPYEPAEDRPLERDDHSGLTYEERKEIWDARNREMLQKRERVDYTNVIDGSGFVDLIVGFALTKTEEQHPEYGLSAAVTLLSLCAGQRYYTKMRHTTNGNTYVATIGHSGSGKESVRDVVAEFIDMAGLSSKLPRCENVQGYKQLAVWVSTHPNCHLMLDEYAESMQRMTGKHASQSLSTLAATLKSAYTQSGKTWNPSAAFGENSVGEIECPNVNINATMTPGGFESCITEQAVETGLLGRFMVFCAERTPDVVHENPDELPTSDQYIESNRSAFDMAAKRFNAMAGPLGHSGIAYPDDKQLDQDAQNVGVFMESLGYHADHESIRNSLADIARRQQDCMNVDRVQVEVMPDAEKRLSEHFTDIANRNRDERGSIDKHIQTVVWTRSPEKTAKFALLFAISRYLVDKDAELRVELCDAERAISLNNKLARRLTALIKDSAATEHSKLVEKIVSFVDCSPNKTATLSKIISFTKQATPKDRDAAIRDAVNSGLIENRKDGKGYTTDLTECESVAKL